MTTDRVGDATARAGLTVGVGRDTDRDGAPVTDPAGAGADDGAAGCGAARSAGVFRRTR